MLNSKLGQIYFEFFHKIFCKITRQLGGVMYGTVRLASCIAGILLNIFAAFVRIGLSGFVQTQWQG
jgi:hypothetical protein